MPYSKFNNDLEFNEDEWVISLINTKTGIGSVFGGHAKIVVEGVKTSSEPGMFSSKLFIGEYHIMEANRLPTATWIPQVLRNTQCNYAVIVTEREDYSAKKEQQYSEASARSVGGITPQQAQTMIDVIKAEKGDIDAGRTTPIFQYAGRWCAYGTNNADNCTSWAEQQLNIIGIGKHLITDSSKSAPFLHVNSAETLDSGTSCLIL